MQINILEVKAGVLMLVCSVTISYSSCCLTTETVKYTNENSFIENLAASKYSICSGVVVPGEVGILLIYVPNFFFKRPGKG